MMSKRFNLLMVCVLASQPLTAAIVLYDDFDGGGLGTGDGTSVNGGFQLFSNGSNGTGTVGETPSNATIATAADSFDNSGIVSINSFDASSSSAISATWVVTSQTGVGANFNNTELLLQGGTSNGTGDGTGFRPAPYIEFFIESTGQWQIRANDGVNAVTLFDGGGLVGGVPTGYSVTLDLDATGWEISSSGFSANPTQSGAWSGGFDFTDLQTDLYAAAMIQTKSNTGASMNVNSISVNVVPEPSSLVLASLGLLSLVGYRRRKH